MKILPNNLKQTTAKLKPYGNFPFPMGEMSALELKFNREITDMIFEKFIKMAEVEWPSENEIIGSLLATRTILRTQKLKKYLKQISEDVDLNKWKFKRIFFDDNEILKYFVEFTDRKAFRKQRKYVELNYDDVLYIHAKGIYYRLLYKLKHRSQRTKTSQQASNEEQICILLHDEFTKFGITFTNIRSRAFIEEHIKLFNLAYEMDLQDLIELVKKNPALEEEIADYTPADQDLDAEELHFLAIEDFLIHETHHEEGHGHHEEHGEHDGGHHGGDHKDHHDSHAHESHEPHHENHKHAEHTEHENNHEQPHGETHHEDSEYHLPTDHNSTPIVLKRDDSHDEHPPHH